MSSATVVFPAAGGPVKMITSPVTPQRYEPHPAKSSLVCSSRFSRGEQSGQGSDRQGEQGGQAVCGRDDQGGRGGVAAGLQERVGQEPVTSRQRAPSTFVGLWTTVAQAGHQSLRGSQSQRHPL